MNKRKTAAIATAAALALASAVTAAQAADNGRPHRGEPPIFAALKLTDAQKAQIQKLNENYRAEMGNREARSQSWQQWQSERNALLQSKTFDSERARALVARQQQERENFELKQLEHEHAVFQVLTPAQQKQFLQEQGKHHPMAHQPRKDEPRPLPERAAPDAQ